MTVSEWDVKAVLVQHVDGDCEGIEQHFVSTWVPWRYPGEGKGCCGELRLCTVLDGSGSKWGLSMESNWVRAVTHLEEKELKERERMKEVRRRMMNGERGRISKV